MNIKKRHPLPFLNIQWKKIYASPMKKAWWTLQHVCRFCSNDDSGEDDCSLSFRAVQFVKLMVLSA